MTGSLDVGIRAVLRLAWPAILSYLLNNTYRINDQFWVQGLGGDAQAAIGASLFVLIMNFAVLFLAVGGTLALVARAVGAGDVAARDGVLRHALLLGLFLGVGLTAAGTAGTPWIVGLLGLEGPTARMAEQYLGTLFLCMLPLVFIPIIDNALIGMGNTLLPMLMQLLSLLINFLLNPLLIYGARAAEHAPSDAVAPIASLAAHLASAFGLEEGLGMRGAALATVISRLVAVLLGLFCLLRLYRVRLVGAGRRPDFPLMRDILAISAPTALSIAFYAGVYWALLNLVLTGLGEDAVAGLGIGFQVFEGVAFPCYLGVGMAGASLVGRALGARRQELAWEAVASVRRLGILLGALMTAVFLLGGAPVARIFTRDEGVLRETVAYVTALAFSQLFVAIEVVHEKILAGAGHTRPPMWVSASGNLLRIPLAWLLAGPLGLASLGVWWAINLTTFGKAVLQLHLVRRGTWAVRSLRPARRA